MPDEAKAELWPLDFESLRKGDVIGADRVEEIASGQRGHRVHRGDKAFSLTLLNLISAIKSRRGELRTRQDGECLRILKDDEYADDDRRRVKQGVRKIVQTVALPAPDMSALSAGERDQWDRAQSYSSRHAEALIRQERELRQEEKILAAGSGKSLK